MDQNKLASWLAFIGGFKGPQPAAASLSDRLLTLTSLFAVDSPFHFVMTA